MNTIVLIRYMCYPEIITDERSGQLVKVSAQKAGDRGFESLSPQHLRPDLHMYFHVTL